jgi:hypothetical protein
LPVPPTMKRTHLTVRWLQLSPILKGQMSGNLSRVKAFRLWERGMPPNAACHLLASPLGYSPLCELLNLLLCTVGASAEWIVHPILLDPHFQTASLLLIQPPPWWCPDLRDQVSLRNLPTWDASGIWVSGCFALSTSMTHSSIHLIWKQNSTFLPLCDPSDHHSELSLEDKLCKCFWPLFLGIATPNSCQLCQSGPFVSYHILPTPTTSPTS